MPTLNVPSPVGPLTLVEQDGALIRLGWGDVPDDFPDSTPNPLLVETARQLAAYFAGALTEFNIPLSPPGTEYQKRVWWAMNEIPYGGTWTYGELAKRVDTVPRAIGGACGANPIPVILPCHRVLAANGKSGGYSGKGGLMTKTALLDIENRTTRLL
jgi:methylated-DNA-[protein]-cysteine S-methyltransferase